MGKAGRSQIEFSDFSFDPATCFLRKRGRAVPLKKQSAEVLALLLRNAGEVVSRQAIREHVWKDRLIEFDQGINACIRDIRQALDDDPRKPRFIETHPRIGYRFRARVHEPGVRATRKRLRWVFGSTALAILVIAWAVGAFGPMRPPAPASHEPERIAVMPFRTLLDDSEHAELAERLTDLFVLRLSQLQSRALVISADDLFGEGKSEPGMGDVSRWLEADYIVAGSIDGEDDTTRLNLRLIRTDGYVHLWTTSITFDAISELDIDALIPHLLAAMDTVG